MADSLFFHNENYLTSIKINNDWVNRQFLSNPVSSVGSSFRGSNISRTNSDKKTNTFKYVCIHNILICHLSELYFFLVLIYFVVEKITSKACLYIAFSLLSEHCFILVLYNFGFYGKKLKLCEVYFLEQHMHA